MIMVLINWLILLAVSENLSHNFPNLKGESVWSLTLGDDNKSITGEGPTMDFGLEILDYFWWCILKI